MKPGMNIEVELKEGCKFCREEKEIGDEDTNMAICKSKTTGESYIVFYAASDYGDWTEWNHKINYCPLCGTRLKEKNS